MGLGIPPLDIKMMLESNPLKSRILVRRLAVMVERISITPRHTLGPRHVRWNATPLRISAWCGIVVVIIIIIYIYIYIYIYVLQFLLCIQ